MVHTPKSKKAQRKAAGLEQHKQQQKAKKTKKKERKKASLPARHTKSKKY